MAGTEETMNGKVTDDLSSLSVNGGSKTGESKENGRSVSVTAEERKARKEQQKKEKAAAKAAKAEKKANTQQKSGGKGKKMNRDGMEVKKEDDFGAWYSQLVTKAEMIDFYDISGCYILRPWSFSMWDIIHEWFDGEIKKLGVKNAYFPLFVSEKRLTKEEDHIEGFAAEVAWVTRSGKKELDEPIAVRPTSETIMYPAYAKWIRSRRDLPLKLNQWSNVVRWEFKDPTPFIRSREFLWQEGHSAFAEKPEADEEVLTILNLYRQVYEDLLAVPVIRGRKSEKEKFAGGLYTTTVEGFIPTNGRAIQGATSHCLGQNFSKMFKIQFQDGDSSEGKEPVNVWQNSWGLTTRTIGVMAMVHGDNKGLVLPPRLATLQVVIVPIVRKGQEETVVGAADALGEELIAEGLRVKVDSRLDKNPGWKFNYWELKGVPVRVELGPRDIEAGEAMVTLRHNGEKKSLKRDGITKAINSLLEDIQKAMLEKARKERDEHVVKVSKWEEFVPALDKKNMVISTWCEETACEEVVKEKSKQEAIARGNAGEADSRALSGAAKTLCIPFEDELARLGFGKLPEDATCFACEKKAVSYTMWGRSY
eukprot:Plantae.Rhodophyta-Hildenbrandia_rubra.ctg1912.p1 GENE.Plantae.Rhodophyta-Hildenbrandia_rubra.ctg1912~~Plantae.Rhodophyta-Hildenbrandia_rubra.ctg1912.p1  ORF type:complete len:592 (-),score=147.20 Plantae.Rhodophyta-Hildenbrandia_rubra.ctg1912:128-1903(-)